MPKPILCLDFDGVCHSYTSGWQGVETIPDPPVDDMWSALLRYHTYFDIHIHSSRSGQPGGIPAMMHWFDKHCPIKGPAESAYDTGGTTVYYNTAGDTVLKLSFPRDKPPAFLGMDDRVMLFTGAWPDAQDLLAFKPWNK